MSDVPFGPRIAGRPTHSTGTPLDLEHADHLFDLLGVEFDPALVAEFVEAAARARALFRCGDLRRIVFGRVVQLGVSSAYRPGLAASVLAAVGRTFRLWLSPRPPAWRPLGICLGVRLGARVLLVVFLVGLLLGDRLADRHAIVDAEHDDDGVGLFVGEDALGGRGPIGGLAARLILDQAGEGLVLADHAHVGLLGIGVFQAIAEPVGHGVAEHQHVTFGHACRAWRARARGKNPGAALAGLLLLLEWREEIAAEPAAATLWRLPLRRTAEAAEIEKLRRRRARDPDQQRDRNRQHDQRAGLGEHAQKGLWFRHPARSQWIREVSNIVAESGRKRADFPHKPGFRRHRQGLRRIVVFRA